MRYAILIVLAALLGGLDGEAQARNPRGTLIPSLIGACTGPAGTSGTLAVSVTQPRTTGSDHLLVFFDATATTDSATLGGANSVFQDVYYSWDFGDAGASGTSKWAYGAKPGGNSMNVATGGVASHLYIVPDGQGDTPFTATLTATDGTHTVVCTAPTVTAYDATGTHGFSGTNTVCVSASGTPTAGSGGCPTGASVLNQSSFATALSGSRSGKRVLFKCGDTFTGDNYSFSGVKARVGAYGGCQGTQTNRPIFSDTSTNDEIDIVGTAGDVVISDIDFEGNGTANGAIGTNTSPFLAIAYQITLYNVNASGTQGAFSVAQGAQWGLIASAMQNMGSHIGVFINYSEINPPPIGMSGNTFNNLDYTAVVGNLLNGTGNTVNNGSGQEVLRLSACRMCTIENNTIENANTVGGVYKQHGGNTYDSCGNGFTGTACPTFPCTVTPPFVNTNCWVGVWVEFIMATDNAFLGVSGGVPVDIEPQSSAREEHLRNIVIERNNFNGTATQWGSPGQIRLSALNATIRDNVFYSFAQGPHLYQEFSINVGQLGLEPVPTGWEIYNNTCVIPNPQDNLQSCIALNGFSMNAPPQNGFVKNNLMYAASGTHTMIQNTGTGSSVSNNSGNAAGSPAFTNASGSFSLLSDFKPTANYTGATNVPVWYDALGIAWPSTWDLGAVKH